MTRTTGAMRWAANFVGLSAILHILALAFGGFGPEALRLLPFGIVYAGLAYGLLKGWRWLGYIVFIVMLIGISLAASQIWAYGAVPGWLYGTIAVTNILAVLALFGALWKSPRTA